MSSSSAIHRDGRRSEGRDRDSALRLIRVTRCHPFLSPRVDEPAFNRPQASRRALGPLHCGDNATHLQSRRRANRSAGGLPAGRPAWNTNRRVDAANAVECPTPKAPAPSSLFRVAYCEQAGHPVVIQPDAAVPAGPAYSYSLCFNYSDGSRVSRHSGGDGPACCRRDRPSPGESVGSDGEACSSWAIVRGNPQPWTVSGPSVSSSRSHPRPVSRTPAAFRP